jgi:hypothetical protein
MTRADAERYYRLALEQGFWARFDPGAEAKGVDRGG